MITMYLWPRAVTGQPGDPDCEIYDKMNETNCIAKRFPLHESIIFKEATRVQLLATVLVPSTPLHKYDLEYNQSTLVIAGTSWLLLICGRDVGKI